MFRVSRLRRLFTSGKIFFVTCNVLRTRPAFHQEEFEILARAFDRVRQRRGFLVGGYVFMPDVHSYGGPGPIHLNVDVLNLPAEETARL